MLQAKFGNAHAHWIWAPPILSYPPILITPVMLGVISGPNLES